MTTSRALPQHSERKLHTQLDRVAQDIGVAYKGKYYALLAIMMWAGKVQAPTHT
jgi:hypothetical protein